MIIPYHRIAICLGFFEGDRIREWKDDQIRKLQDRVKKGTNRDDEDLWTEFKKDFVSSLVDTAGKEHTAREFNSLEQKADDLDDYIICFNNLSARLEYDRESPLLIEKFTEGLAKSLHMEILCLDIWPETLDQWQEAARRAM